MKLPMGLPAVAALIGGTPVPTSATPMETLTVVVLGPGVNKSAPTGISCRRTARRASLRVRRWS